MKRLLILGVLMLAARVAPGDSYRCDDVDDLAKLGYDGSLKVSIVGKNKQCKFSIGGASPDARERVAAVDRNQREADQRMVRRAPDRFNEMRLVQVLIDSATSLGDLADFVNTNLDGIESLKGVSCDNQSSVFVRELELRCSQFLNAKPEEPTTFENGMVTAVLTRPSVLYEVRNMSGTPAVMVVILRGH